MSDTIPIKHRVKMLLGRSTWPYALYIKCRNSSKRYPCSETALTIEGYPRSANTFSIYLARELFKGQLVSSHIHNISSIRAGIRVNAPCVVLFRDGLESVVSLAQKDGVEPGDRAVLEGYLEQWIQMYQFVLQHCEELTLVHFKDLVSDPEGFVCLLAQLKGIILSREDAAQYVATARSKMELKESQKAEQGSSLPREKREREKVAFREAVSSLKSVGDASRVYQALLSKLKS